MSGFLAKLIVTIVAVCIAYVVVRSLVPIGQGPPPPVGLPGTTYRYRSSIFHPDNAVPLLLVTAIGLFVLMLVLGRVEPGTVTHP